MNRGYNPITEGLIKAMGFLVQGRTTPVKAKVQEVHFGTKIHATRCLNPSERDAVTTLMNKIHDETDREIGEKLVHELRTKHPVKGVRVKRAIRIDHSKYQGDLLAQVKKFGGKKEQARAEKRRAKTQLLLAA